MKIVVLGNDAAFETLKKSSNNADWIKLNDTIALKDHANAGAIFDLREEEAEHIYAETNIPLFVHSVINTTMPPHKYIRINGWHGFLENETWEVSGDIDDKGKAVLHFLGKKIIACADEPGFISARIIAMIINEAYFAKGENVSTEAAIDTAMKLGTNYPYGPFEWAQKIGIENIYSLLKKLSLQDTRYQPAPALAKLFEN